MSHYDNCRPGYCAKCGAAPGNIKNGVCEICHPKGKKPRRLAPNENAPPTYARPPVPPGPPPLKRVKEDTYGVVPPELHRYQQGMIKSLREYYGQTRAPVVFTKAETDFMHRRLSTVYAHLVTAMEAAEKKLGKGPRSHAVDMALGDMELTTLATDSALCISVLGKLRDSEN